jgi:transcriptional regulator with XRE-family HTH domain
MPARSKDADSALAAVLRRLRQECEETQESLAQKQEVGMTAGSISMIELVQADPGWSKVRRIIKGLDVSLVELAEAVEREEG